jgi:tripartite-type tricarboxylate transporter receptor subunit TctC
MKHLTLAFARLCIAFFTAAAIAQPAFPERPVRIVVQFPAGAPSDIAARLLAEHVSGKWGKPVIVENMLGAAGNVAAAHVAKAAPDGHTLILSGDAAMTTNVTLYDSLPYHPLRHFRPITLVLTSTNILVVHPSVKADSVGDLVALARRQPGKLSYASAGSGTSQHLGGELLKQMAQIDVIHVPYKGGPAAMQDLLGGRVEMMFANIATALPLIRDGKLRPLAVTSSKRWPATPDLPTVAESGYAGFEAVAWFGLLAPAGTPEPVIRKIYDDVTTVFAIPDVRSRLSNIGLQVVGSSPEEFSTQIREEIVAKGRLVKAAGARAD